VTFVAFEDRVFVISVAGHTAPVERFQASRWHMVWQNNGMKTTIDRAGRVVIPAALRERAGMAAGTEIEVTLDDAGIRLERVAPGPRLVKIGRRLVARPAASPRSRPKVDVAALIEEERSRWP
jgi:AbrB family looped-hinge helix DNA binding protein